MLHGGVEGCCMGVGLNEQARDEHAAQTQQQHAPAAVPRARSAAAGPAHRVCRTAG